MATLVVTVSAILLRLAGDAKERSQGTEKTQRIPRKGKACCSVIPAIRGNFSVGRSRGFGISETFPGFPSREST